MKIRFVFLCLIFLITELFGAEAKNRKPVFISFNLMGADIIVANYFPIDKTLEITFEARVDLLLPLRPNHNDKVFFITMASSNNELNNNVYIHLGWNMEQVSHDYSLEYRILKSGEKITERIDLSACNNNISKIRFYFSYIFEDEHFDIVLENKLHSFFYRYMFSNVTTIVIDNAQFHH